MDDTGADIAAMAHDSMEFEKFYREHVHQVMRFIARRVDDPQLAADLTADVFLAAVESARGYRASRGEPLAWLYGVARNVVAYDRRRRARYWKAAREVSGRALLTDTDAAAMLDRIDASARSRDLYRAMAELSAKDRAVLELVALDGLDVGDAAVALGIRPGTARARLHRARKAMRARVSSPWPTELTTTMEVTP